MFFSIIIPIYNSENWLERCFASIRSQSFNDYEVILVDDGSQDRSAVLCQHYANTDPRVKYYYQNNKGVSSARNKGLSEAEGDWVAFIDADDSYKESFLLSFYSVIEKYKDSIDCFCCGYDFIHYNEYVEKKLPSKGDFVFLDCKDIIELYEAIMLQSVSNKVFRKAILLNNHITMNEEISLGEDLLFNLDYLDHCNNRNIGILNKPLYNYYCDAPDSLNKKYRPDLKDIFEVLIDKMDTYFIKWGLEQEQMAKYNNAVYSMYISSMRNTFRLANKSSYKEKIAYNNKIIKSGRFKHAVQNSDGAVHPLYRAVFHLNNYALIRGLDKIHAIYLKIKNVPALIRKIASNE